MKTILFVLATLLYSNTSIHAQSIGPSRVPEAVIKAFNTKFPAIKDAKWKIEDKINYEVSFSTPEGKKYIEFDSTGKWLQTETHVENDNLPKPVTETIHRQFAGYSIHTAVMVENATNAHLYEVHLQRGSELIEVQLSADGKVLKNRK